MISQTSVRGAAGLCSSCSDIYPSPSQGPEPPEAQRFFSDTEDDSAYRMARKIYAVRMAQALTFFSSGMTAFTSLIFFSDTGGRSTS